MDMWTTSYFSPVRDSKQDLKNREASLVDGKAIIKFTRARDTGDASNDVAFKDDHGVFFIFPVKGGDFNTVNRKMKKHRQTPTASSERVFVKACRNGKLDL